MPKASTKTSLATLKSVTKLKSYLSQLKDATVSHSLASFSAFPKSTTFDGQDSDEHIVLLLRQHPAVFIPRVLLVLGMILLPILIPPLLSMLDLEISAGDTVFAAGVTLLWVMIIISVIAVTFFLWYFNVSIVTNQRIVDIDFSQLFNHTVSECQLEKIEDVTHTNVGMWAVVFDYGTIYIQTAAEQREFEIRNVPRPRDVQDTINDLLELLEP